ncbi:MAG: FAD-binding protein [Cyclobacteriaceae bacterium]
MHYRKNKIAGWGNFPRAESKLFSARNIPDVKEIVQQEEPLISRGMGRSYGDQAINQGKSVLLTRKLCHLLDFDEASGLLSCEAGVSLADIIHTFVPRGWFPLINPGTKYVTIGGAIANDIHGKGHHTDGSFVNCVKDFDIMLADGSIVRASREANQDLFWASFGGLGLLGVILKARIWLRRISTSFFAKKVVKTENLADLLAAFEEYDQQYAYSVAWLDSLAGGSKLGRGVFTAGRPAAVDELPPRFRQNPLQLASNLPLTLPFYLPSFALNTYTVRVLNKVLENVQSRQYPWVHYESFFFPLDAVRHWNRGYGKKGFIQYQFVIPLENGQQNILSLLKMISRSGHAPFLNVLKKFGRGMAESPLSFPMEGYTFAIDFPVRSGLKKLSRTLDQQVCDMGGRIYLGKDALLEQDLFRQMYPRYTEWLEVKRKYDPENVFSSNLSRRLGLVYEQQKQGSLAE